MVALYLTLINIRGLQSPLDFSPCVQNVLVYGSETWAMISEDIHRLERTERMMNRWMCGVKLSDRKANAELLSWLSIEIVSDVVWRGRLRWFEHLERKEPDNWVSACRSMVPVVESVKSRSRGRPRKTWRQCVLMKTRQS